MYLGVIIYNPGQGDAIDAVLRDAARQLRERGFKLAGTVQWNEPDPDSSACDMWLEDLATGRKFHTAPSRAQSAGACRLDASALEDVAGFVANTVAPGLDLIVINRFGKQEAAGNGLRAVMEAAVANDIPLLTALNAAHSTAWDAFSGDASSHLEPTVASVLAWWEAVNRNR